MESARDIDSQLSNPSQQSDRAPMCVCQFRGKAVADHLRGSDQCVEALRRVPLLQMKASKELFIVKTALIWGDCPARECPGGSHQKIPNHCVSWWKETGWTLMGWKGSLVNANSALIKEKISQYRRNVRRRKKRDDRNQFPGSRRN